VETKIPKCLKTLKAHMQIEMGGGKCPIPRRRTQIMNPQILHVPEESYLQHLLHYRNQESCPVTVAGEPTCIRANVTRQAIEM